MERGTFAGGCFFANAATEMDGRPGPVRDAIAAQMTSWAELLADYARAAIERGELRPDTDPEQLAFELDALGTAVNSGWQLHEDATVFERGRRAIAAPAGGRRHRRRPRRARRRWRLGAPLAPARRRAPHRSPPTGPDQRRAIARFRAAERRRPADGERRRAGRGVAAEEASAAIRAELPGLADRRDEPSRRLLVAAGGRRTATRTCCRATWRAIPRRRSGSIRRSRPECA